MKGKKILPLMLLAAMLTACGGGSSGDKPTPTPEPTPEPTPTPTPELSNYFLVGSFNGWEPEEGYQFYTGVGEEALTPSGKDQFVLEEVEIRADDEFKVTTANKGTWYPDGMGNNMSVPEDGVYTIYFTNVGGEPDWLEGYVGYEKTGDLEPVTDVHFYIAGSFNGWGEAIGAEEYELTEIAEGVYGFEGLELAAGDELKVAGTNGKWYPEENVVAEADDTYSVLFNLETGEVALVGSEPVPMTEFPTEVVLTFYAAKGLVLESIPAYEVASEEATFEVDAELESDLFVYVNETTHQEMLDYKDALVEAGWVVVAEQNEDYILALPGEIGYICLVDFEDYVGIQFYTGDPYVNNHWADLAALIAEYVTEEAIPEYTFGGVVDEEYLGYFSTFIDYYGYAPAYINGASLEDIDNYIATLIEAGWDVLGTQAISPEETVLFTFNTSHVAEEDGYATLLVQPLAGVEVDPNVEAVGEVLGINPFFFGYDSSYGLYFVDVYFDTEAVEMQAALAKSMLLNSDLGLELVKEQAGDTIIYGMHNDTIEVTIYGVPAKGLVEITIGEYISEPEDNGLVAATEAAFGLKEGGLAWDARYEEFWTDIYPEVETIDEAYKIVLAAIETLKADFEDLVLKADESKAGSYYYVTWECKAGYITVYVALSDGEVIIEPSVGLYEPVDDRIPQFVLDLGEALYVEFSPLDEEYASFLAFDDEFADMDEAYAEYMLQNYVIDAVAELGFLPVDAEEPIKTEQTEDGIVYYAELQDMFGNELTAVYAFDADGVTEGMAYYVEVAQIPERVLEFFANMFGEEVELEPVGFGMYMTTEEFPYAEEDFDVAANDETYGFINILKTYLGFELVDSSVTETEEGGKSYAYMFENSFGDKLMVAAEFTSLGGCVNDQIVWVYAYNEIEIPEEVETFFANMFGEEAEINILSEKVFGVEEEFPYTEEDFDVAANDETYGFINILETYFGFKLVEKTATPTEEGGKVILYTFQNAEGRTIVVGAEFTSLGGCVGDTIHWMYAMTELEPIKIPEEVEAFFGAFLEGSEIVPINESMFAVYEEFPYAEEDLTVAFKDEEYGSVKILSEYLGFELLDSSVTETEAGGHLYVYTFQDADGNLLIASAETTSLGGVVNDQIVWAYVVAPEIPEALQNLINNFWEEGAIEFKFNGMGFAGYEEFPYAEEDLAVAFEDEEYGSVKILSEYFGFELIDSSVTDTEEGGHLYVYTFQDAEGNLLIASAETTSLGGVVGDHIVWSFIVAE